MATLTHIETDTGTNVNISSATAIGSYTSTGDKLVMVDVSIDAVAGNGDYVMYVKRQINGAGSSYIILPKTTMAAASGETAISGQSGWITVRNGDVLTVYVDGLADDTSTPDYTTRWYELAVQLVTLADDAITAAKFDESTAFPLKAADTGVTQVARVGADGDTLEKLSDEIAAVQADLDNPNQYKADVSGLATTTHLQEVEDKVDTADTVVDAIKAKTDNLPANPAPAGEYDTRLTAIQTDLNNPDQYKADVSGIPAAVWGYATRTLSSFGTLISDIWSHATRTLSAFGFTVATQSDANVTAIKAKTDNLPAIPAPANEYDTELAAIQADLNNPNQYKADVSNLATTAHVQEVEDKVDAIKLKTDNIPANPATAGEYTASLAAIQSDVSGIPDAILTKAIVDTLTVEQVLKVLAAVETGITTGGGTDTIVYTGKDGTVIRLTGVDEDGNRSAVIVIPGA